MGRNKNESGMNSELEALSLSCFFFLFFPLILFLFCLLDIRLCKIEKQVNFSIKAREKTILQHQQQQ